MSNRIPKIVGYLGVYIMTTVYLCDYKYNLTENIGPHPSLCDKPLLVCQPQAYSPFSAWAPWAFCESRDRRFSDFT